MNKHHKAKAPFECVKFARYWYDNSRMGYETISHLINDIYATRQINQDWSKPAEKVCYPSTVRDWINETRAMA